MKSTTRKNRYLWRMVALLLVAWALLTIRIDANWLEFHGPQGAWMSASVRNFQTHGMRTFNFTFTRQTGPYIPGEPYYPYTNHPPMPVWLITLFAQFAGLQEVTVRFVFVSVTLFSIAALYLLTRRIFDEKTAFWACILYTSMPLILYYGRFSNWFFPGIVVGLLYTAVYVNWLRQPSWPRFALLAVLAGVSVYTFWINILYVAALGFSTFIIGNRLQRIQTVAFGLVGIIAASSLLALYATVTPGLLNTLRVSYLGRASTYESMYGRGEVPSPDYIHSHANVRDLNVEKPTQFTLSELAVDVLRDLNETLTGSFLILGLLGIPLAFRRANRTRRWVLANLFFVGILFMVLLPNAVYMHQFYEIYIFPPLAICGAVALIGPRMRWRWWRPIVVTLFISGLIISGVLLRLYHTSSGMPHMVLGDRVISYEETILTLQNQTAVEDHIMTNVLYFYNNLTIDYYANRNVIWATSPQQALVEAEALQEEVIYMYCVAEPSVPPGFEDFPVRIGENTCWFFTIQPGKEAVASTSSEAQSVK